MKRPFGTASAIVVGLVALAIFGGKAPEPPASAPAAQAPSARVDINRASAAELMVLKGISKEEAEAIIRGRPYVRRDELVQKKIVPEAVYNEIKDRITAN